MQRSHQKAVSNLENKIGDKNVSKQSKDLPIVIDPAKKGQGEPQVCKCEVNDQHRQDS